MRTQSETVGMFNGVKYEEEFFLNSRSMKLFSCRWLPVEKEIKSLVFLCHGYGVECSVFMKATGIRLAQAGYAVFGLDYEGHGKSEGQRGYIKNFYDVVDDCVAFFKSIRDLQEYKNKARFLLGESMGGAVALLIHRKEPQDWNGAVLVAPMCKIAESLKPPRIVSVILTQFANIIPTWKIVPTKDILDVGYRDSSKREEIRSNPLMYRGRWRLKTAVELLKASENLEQRLNEVTLPFLILHGEDDVVTDPGISRLLYESAASLDKKLEIYPGMWHGLLAGEPDANMEAVYKEILEWLGRRSATSVRRGPELRKDFAREVREGGGNGNEEQRSFSR